MSREQWPVNDFKSVQFSNDYRDDLTSLSKDEWTSILRDEWISLLRDDKGWLNFKTD